MKPVHCLAAERLVPAWLHAIRLASLALLGVGCVGSRVDADTQKLQAALTLHASFDRGLDADFARGDARLQNAPSMKERVKAVPGLPAGGEVVLAPGEGVTGNALRFVRKQAPILFFAGRDNVAWNPTNWSDTVSFWLRLDPETELEPGYTDPIQITPRAWNDAAFFVEFGKDETPRHFRLGAYADFNVWNPDNRKWEDIPWPEKPLVSVTRHPFSRERWTHVAFTWESFNTGRPDGIARLYLNGAMQGTLSPRIQTYTWNPEEVLVMLGMSYKGLWDELAIFDRALNSSEIARLTATPGLSHWR